MSKRRTTHAKTAGRIRRRSASQGSRKQQKRALPVKAVLKGMALSVAAVAVLYLGSQLKSVDVPDILPVEQIDVAGDLRFIDRGEVQKIIAANIDGGYFTVDLGRIREQLQKLPWVKDVAVRRQWPAGLQVNIEEQKPLAYWNDNAYINQDGDVFQPAKVDHALALPQLNGPAGQQDKVWQFMNRLYREMALLDFDVIRLDLDQRRAWQMQIVEAGEEKAKPVTIRLGRFDTEKRLQRFIRVLPALMRNRKNGEAIATIDMRYPNGFAVKMIQNETESAALENAGMAIPGFRTASLNTNSRLALIGTIAVTREGEA